MVFSLRVKIVLLMAAAVGVFTLVTVFAFYRGIRENEREAHARAAAVAGMIAQVPVAERMHGGQAAEMLERLLPLLFARDRNLVFVVFTDKAGRVLAQQAAAPEAGGPAVADLPRLADPAYQGQPNWKLLDITLEDPDGQVRERLRVAYSLADARRRAARESAQMALLTLLLLGASLGGASLLAARLTRPLEKLADAMRRVQYGELGSTVEMESKDEIADLARAFNEMSTELRSRERLRSNFARFVSSAVADKVIAENRTVRLGGERRAVTVLFADIRGFTTLSAGQPPERVVALLNECFRALVDVIPRYGGILDKFIGDGLMAIFNAPNELPVHEVCALMVGVEMQRVMRDLNQRRRAGGQDELRLGIGINTGEAVAGTFGSERRLEYTVIGAAVNLAQRIEDHAGPGELLLGETTYQAVRHLVEAEALEPVLLKGLKRPIHLYRVKDLTQAVRRPSDDSGSAAARSPQGAQAGASN